MTAIAARRRASPAAGPAQSVRWRSKRRKSLSAPARFFILRAIQKSPRNTMTSKLDNLVAVESAASASGRFVASSLRRFVASSVRRGGVSPYLPHGRRGPESSLVFSPNPAGSWAKAQATFPRAIVAAKKACSNLTREPSIPARDGSHFAEDGTNLVEDGPNLARDGAAFVDDGTNLTPDGANFAQHGKNLTDHGPHLAEDGRNLAEYGLNFIRRPPGAAELTLFSQSQPQNQTTAQI